MTTNERIERLDDEIDALQKRHDDHATNGNIRAAVFATNELTKLEILRDRLAEGGDDK